MTPSSDDSVRDLKGGAFRCRDCGHTVTVTTMDDVRRLGARYKSSTAFYVRCPKCYSPLKRNDGVPLWSLYERMSIWETAKLVLSRMMTGGDV